MVNKGYVSRIYIYIVEGNVAWLVDRSHGSLPRDLNSSRDQLVSL